MGRTHAVKAYISRFLSETCESLDVEQAGGQNK